MPSDQEPLLPPPVTSGSSLGTSPSSPNTLRSKLARRASGQSHYPTTSSDRSKGKQKAEDQDEIEAQRSYPFPRPSSPESPSTPQGTGRPVNVIFSGEGAEGGGNLEIWIEEGQSVGSVKDQIRHLRPALSESSLRLIHSGRLLTDGILLLPWLRSLEERVKRQAGGVGGDVESVLKEVGLTEDTKDHGTGRDKEATPGSSPLGISRSHRKSKQLPSDKVFLHCNVGSKEDKSATPQDDVEEPTAPRRRGFDVLLDAGLSAAEVAQMRRQFYESRGEEVPEGMDLGDQNDEHARALEEQWIEGDLTADTAETTTEGMYTSILNGLLTGFLFPILPFFYFRDSPLPNFADADVEADSQDYDEEAADRDRAGDEASARVANTHGIGGEMVEAAVFGKRMQMGILLGTLINVAFGALRFMN